MSPSSKTLLLTLLALAALAALAAAQQQTPVPKGSKKFVATVRRRNLSGKPEATVLTATLYYDGNQAGKERMHLRYAGLQPAQSEYRDYETKRMTRPCDGGKCDLFQLVGTAPRFFAEGGELGAPAAYSTGPDGGFFKDARQCTAYTFGTPEDVGGVQTIALFGDYICRAQFTNGEVWEFDYPADSNPNGSPANPPGNQLNPPNNAGCPDQPVCSTVLDLTFGVDESGSINQQEWADMNAFVKAVADGVTVGNLQTMLGLTYFSGVTYTETQNPTECCGRANNALPQLTGDKTAFLNFLNGHQPLGGHTCIGCGVRESAKYYPNPTRTPRRGVMVVITDGFNNRESNFLAADLANARADSNADQGITILAVGVDGFDQEQMLEVAGGKQENVFTTNKFDKLIQDVLPGLLQRICEVAPLPEPCEGVGCAGICGCDAACLCPDTCDDGNACTQEGCVPATKACGPTGPPTKCPDPNADNKCIQGKCDPATGACVGVGVNCDDNNACTTDECDPATGECKNVPKVCTDNNACTTEQCNPATGECTAPQPLECPEQDPKQPNNLCRQGKCDPAQGCVYFDTQCGDGNVCTTDTCNPTTGKCESTQRQCEQPADTCKEAKCVEPGGCVVTPKTCAEGGICQPQKCENGQCVNDGPARNCDDNNACTADACDPVKGCQNVPTNACDDNNACTKDVCDPETGKCDNTGVVECPDCNGKCEEKVCDPVAGCLCKAVTCDDGNFCTVDTCDPGQGCQTAPLVCDDNDACTDSVCDPQVKACVHTPKICVRDGQPEDPCKDYKCVEGECKDVPIDVPKTCNDDDPCTNEVCIPGAGCANLPVDCNDGNPCTADVCAPDPADPTQPQCQNTPIDGIDCGVCKAQCPDDDPCNPTKCVPGATAKDITCEPLTPFACDDTVTNNKCQQFAPIAADGKCKCEAKDDPKKCTPANQCETAQCNPQTGTCDTEPVDCTDNNSCFDTKCEVVNDAPKCVPQTPVLLECGAGKQPDASPCLEYQCDGTGPEPKCVEKGPSINCADTNPCTAEKCVADGLNAKCVFSEPSELAAKCDKTNLCAPEVCDPAQGKCVPQPVVDDCPASKDLCQEAVCDPATGKCAYQPKDAECFDGVCFFGKCDPATGQCDAAPLACEADAKECQTNAQCVPTPDGGKTVGLCKTESTCAQADPCNPQVCNGEGKCETQPVVCDDGNPCTVDKCQPSAEDATKAVCVVTGAALECDDSDPCTVSKCVDNGQGQPTCQHAPNDQVCKNENLCLQLECQKVSATESKCVTSTTNPPVECAAPDNACQVNECNPATGKCEIKDRDLVCDDSNACTVDRCDPATGECTFTLNQCTDLITGCQDAKCITGPDGTGECQTFALNCTANATGIIIDACHYAFCGNDTLNGTTIGQEGENAANTTACAVLPIPGTINSCGVCNGPAACELSESDDSAAAAAGGVIAGAVVAGCAALGLGAFAARKAGVVPGMATQAPMSAACHNPLFEQDCNTRDNPFFNDAAGGGGGDAYVPLNG